MALQGSLQDMSIADLMEVFQEDCKSGQLQVVSRTARAELTIDNGRVISALLFVHNAATPLYSGSEVLSRLHTWQDGEFLFEPFVAKRQVALYTSPSSQQRPRSNEPPIVIVQEPEPAPTDAFVTAQLSIEEWYLLSACMHTNSLRSAAVASGISLRQALQLANGLAKRGLLRMANEQNVPQKSAVVQQQPSIMPQKPRAASRFHPDSRLLQAVKRHVRDL
jgi:hypothetical protein